MDAVLANRIWTVYALIDPRNSEIRYVGVTHGNPQVRFARHLSSAKRQKRFRSYVLNWIVNLSTSGLIPTLIVLETGFGQGWDVEQKWIAFYKEQGARLTNISMGGAGPLGCIRSAETRKKLADANRGKKQNPELVERRIAKIRGQRHTAQARTNMAAGAKGRKVSEEGVEKIRARRRDNPDWNRKISESNRGLKRSEETKKHVSQAHLGIRQSESARQKISAGNKESWYDPVIRERRAAAIADGNKRAWQDPEKREKRLSAIRAAWVRKKEAGKGVGDNHA